MTRLPRRYFLAFVAAAVLCGLVYRMTGYAPWRALGCASVVFALAAGAWWWEAARRERVRKILLNEWRGDRRHRP